MPAIMTIAPGGPNSAPPTSTSGRLVSARPGKTARLAVCSPKYSSAATPIAHSNARGMSRRGLRASPAGTRPDSKPTKA